MPCVKSVREPDAANPHVRFDERGEETGRTATPSPLPRLTSTLPFPRFLIFLANMPPFYACNTLMTSFENINPMETRRLKNWGSGHCEVRK